MKKLQPIFYYGYELIYRICYTILNTILVFMVSYRYKQVLIYILLPRGLTHMISTDITEIFLTYIYLAGLISLLIGLNIAIIQVYFFFRPGLYQFEANQGFIYLIIYQIIYLYFYLVIYPILIQTSWAFFAAYAENFKPIQLIFEPKLNQYLCYVKNIGLLLNLLAPILILMTVFLTFIPIVTLTKYRKFIYIVAILLSTFITPPDYLSQILLAVLLIKFYELQMVGKLIHENYHKTLIGKPIKTNKNTHYEK